MEKGNKIYNETKVIYDGDDYIIVKPLTTESVLYFTDDNKDYAKLFEKYNDYEDTYLVVDKKDTPASFYGIQNRNGSIRIYYFNSLNKFDGRNFENIEISDFNTSIPSVVRDSIDPFLYEGTTYGILKDIKNGKDFSLNDLRDSSDIIGKIRYNEKRPGKSMVSIIFDDAEDYFTSMGADEDSLYIIRDLFGSNYYNSLEIINYDQSYEDWKEGFLLNFNEKNNKLLYKILTYVSPGLSKQKISEAGDPWKKKVSNLLLDMFETQIDFIITDYTNMENSCRVEQLKKDIEDDACDVLGEYGVFMGDCFSRYFTTVNILLQLYEKIDDKSVSLKYLFSELVDGTNMDYSDWMYESWCQEDYEDELNEQITNSLTSIIERINDSEEFADTVEYGRLYDKYVGKYGLEKSHKNPIYDDKFFIIRGINSKNNKLIVGVGENKYGHFKDREYDEEGFNLFLNQPELF